MFEPLYEIVKADTGAHAERTMVRLMAAACMDMGALRNDVPTQPDLRSQLAEARGVFLLAARRAEKALRPPTDLEWRVLEASHFFRRPPPLEPARAARACAAAEPHTHEVPPVHLAATQHGHQQGDV